MPNKDKTGPEGKGPRTGRGKGNCENIAKGPCNQGLKKGLGRRFNKNEPCLAKKEVK